MAVLAVPMVHIPCGSTEGASPPALGPGDDALTPSETAGSFFRMDGTCARRKRFYAACRLTGGFCLLT